MKDNLNNIDRALEGERVKFVLASRLHVTVDQTETACIFT